MSTTTVEITKADLSTGLAALRAEADALVVRDQDTYRSAMDLALTARKYVKDVKSKLQPGIDSARDHLNELRNQMAAYTSPAEQIDSVVTNKAKAWAEEERRKAEAEQRRLQEEARIAAQKKADEERRERERQTEIDRKQREKEIAEARKNGELKAREAARLQKEAAAESEREKQRAQEEAARQVAEVPQVEVKADIPVVAGVAARRNWKFKIVDARRIPGVFLVPDEVAIGQMVRNAKDKRKAEFMCPGIEVWSE